MKVQNMTSSKGNKVANQFILHDQFFHINGMNWKNSVAFQSYDSIIAIKHPSSTNKPHVALDSHYWDYSVTTSKYRNQFLGESKAETQAKIDSGEYILTDLN